MMAEAAEVVGEEAAAEAAGELGEVVEAEPGAAVQPEGLAAEHRDPVAGALARVLLQEARLLRPRSRHRCLRQGRKPRDH